MTWIVDGSGTRWVDDRPPKRRQSPRAIRFAEIKVGDQLMRRWTFLPGGTDVWYYLVTDLWFDPVAGQKNDAAGRMVAVRWLNPRTGEPDTRKQAHTIRGLASQGFHYADMDYTAHIRATLEGIRAGAVVGIGKAHVIRARPKLPGDRF